MEGGARKHFDESMALTIAPRTANLSEGKSRSVTLVIAYLMLTQRWTLKQALNHVR